MTPEAYTAQAEKLIRPVREIHAAAVDQTGKLVKMQISALQSYAEFAITHWRAALEVKDPDSMKDFAVKHREFVETVAEKAARDARSVIELGNDCTAAVQKVLRERADLSAVRKAA